ncbi:SCP2 sterol-binding domain-containing protein [Halomarina ordinaria]|uniref:SCP2 sterol-binding domain-containing protein n=1 Tax=Halomarina ordinaria TaxID=3033939 RepID=A0ABD5U651_9EURY|nr:SCP2 sterol-binding domain-containing protein [Halomarina sp. PSRA2]
MAHEFPSEAWIRAWQAAVNEDDRYGELSEGWGVGFDGDMVFHLRADDRLPTDRYFFVGLEDGEAYGCREVDSPDAVDHGFVLRGRYADWVAMTRGDLGAIEGLMDGRLELDGDLQRVLAYSAAATRLVDLAATVDTEYVY